MKKLALRGNQIQVGDILTGVWFFPNGRGEVVELHPFEGRTKDFAGEGSQMAIIKDCSYKMSLPAIDWFIVERG